MKSLEGWYLEAGEGITGCQQRTGFGFRGTYGNGKALDKAYRIWTLKHGDSEEV